MSCCHGNKKMDDCLNYAYMQHTKCLYICTLYNAYTQNTHISRDYISLIRLASKHAIISTHMHTH